MSEERDERIRTLAVDVITLIRKNGASINEGSTALAYALTICCRAAGGTKDQMLAWCGEQWDLNEEDDH